MKYQYKLLFMTNMKSYRVLFSMLLLCIVLIFSSIFAQSTKIVDNKSKIVLSVISDRSNTSVIFEFTLIKDGKKVKTEKLRTPFTKTFEQQDMTFILKKIHGKSDISYKVVNTDRQNRELGSTISTSPNIRINIVGQNVNVVQLQ